MPFHCSSARHSLETRTKVRPQRTFMRNNDVNIAISGCCSLSSRRRSQASANNSVAQNKHNACNQHACDRSIEPGRLAHSSSSIRRIISHRKDGSLHAVNRIIISNKFGINRYHLYFLTKNYNPKRGPYRPQGSDSTSGAASCSPKDIGRSITCEATPCAIPAISPSAAGKSKEVR